MHPKYIRTISHLSVGLKYCLQLTDNMNMIRLPWILSLVLLQACETKQYEDQFKSPPVVDSSSALFGSNLAFGGLESISSVNDTSAILNWSQIEGAQEYYIYDVTGGLFRLIDRVDAPADSYAVTRLESGTDYSFLVRVKDDQAQLDNNFSTISITTDAQPDPPSFISTTTLGDHPTWPNDVRSRPSLLVLGTRPGDRVSIFDDAACTNLIGESPAEIQSSFDFFQTDPLSSYGTYTFYGKITNINGIASNCSGVFADYEYLECPDGYIPINVSAGNSYVTQDFCVMKFEAKAWLDSDSDGLVENTDFFASEGCFETACTTENWGIGAYKPGSTDENKPWRKLDIQTAKDACRSLGRGYDLINIREWMAIAEIVEAAPINWSNTTIAVGECLLRGNVGVDDGCGYNYDGIDDRAEAVRLADSLSPMLIVGAEQLWDFSGNVAEWVDFGGLDTSEDAVTLGPQFCSDPWTEYGSTTLCDASNNGSTDFDEYFYAPHNAGGFLISSYNSDYGLGQFEGGSGGAILRGGSYRNGSYAGIYSLSLAATVNTTSEEIGFRCVYRPSSPL